jgi:streptomycin 6-kinase
MDTQLPSTFIERMTNTYGSAGAEWCAALPSHLARLALQWDLDIGDPFPLTMNYVCRAMHRTQRTPLVLKTGFPAEEFAAELAMYDHYRGRTGVQCIAIDRSQYAVVLEHVSPGTRLDEAGMSDQEQAHVIARLIRRGVFPHDRGVDIPSIDTIVNDVRPHARVICAQRPELFSMEHIERACDIMTTSTARTTWYPLHGDLHAGNMLLRDHCYVQIDPQGLIGPMVYECTPHIRDRHNTSANRQNGIEHTYALQQVYAEALGISMLLVAQWCYATAVCSAWWSFQSTQSIEPADYRAVDDFWTLLQMHQAA